MKKIEIMEAGQPCCFPLKFPRRFSYSKDWEPWLWCFAGVHLCHLFTLSNKCPNTKLLYQTAIPLGNWTVQQVGGQNYSMIRCWKGWTNQNGKTGSMGSPCWGKNQFQKTACPLRRFEEAEAKVNSCYSIEWILGDLPQLNWVQFLSGPTSLFISL